MSCVWQTVRDHLYHLCVHATDSCFLVERAVVGLLRLAIRLLRREDISSQVGCGGGMGQAWGGAIHEVDLKTACHLGRT